MTHDAVILGAGHNGLVAAAYLARAGRSVLVVERRREIGGLAVTEEVGAGTGFRCGAVFAGVETFSPAIIDELGLEGHGLRLLPSGGFLVLGTADHTLYFPPPADAAATSAAAPPVAGLSPDDAAALVDFDGFLRRLADALAPLLAAPLPDLEPSGAAGFLDLLWPALRLRRLGRRDLAEAMRLLPMPIADVVDERFENPLLRAAVAAGGLTGSWLAPRSAGSTFNLLLHRCGGRRGAIGYPRFAAGGPGALSAALAAAARAAGAEIRTSSEVERIVVESGTASGVVLAGGEEIRAGAVISGADPKKTWLELLEPRHLEPSFLRAARNIRCRGTVAIAGFTLDRLPPLGGVSDPEKLRGRIQIGASVDDLERAFDDAKYGRLPRRPYLDLTIPSIADPGLAPAGKHVLHAWVQYPPYHLRDRGWDDARDDLAEIVERTISEVSPGFSDIVLERRLSTPVDLERRFGVTEGCLYHVEPALDQELYMRPLPRWAGYRTPIRNLYLCGAGTHGGGGLTGLPGRNAARVILKD
ncbi:MAG: NAD(P)/FAD-dependent oxidoreductase [Thermoanaerobaculia bacterium]